MPSLPALSPSQTATKFNTATDFKTKAAERQRRAQERRMRAATEGPKRHAFLGGLLNEDLQNLCKWHGMRPHHEQKRFVKAVDSIYSSFNKMDKTLPQIQVQAAQQAKVAQQQQAAYAAAVHAVVSQDDPYLRESPRGAPALGESASAPNLPSKPIEVFEQNKKKGRRRQGSDGGSDGASVSSSQATKNNLEQWLDAQSMRTSTTGASGSTLMTTFSQLTATSSGGLSLCSEPGTTAQAHFRTHKRALAANYRSFGTRDQHDAAYLKDGVPNSCFPECERMATQFRDAYGHKPLGGGEVHVNAYKSVFKENKIPFVEKFLEVAPKEQKEQMGDLVRSLQFLRTAHKRQTSSVQRVQMDLAENARLWRPHHQEPVFSPEQRNLSKVPLGAIGLGGQKKRAQENSPRPSSGPGIHSPSVSGLGSLPLTPRSLPTPMVGGRDMPMMSEPLAPIAEAY
jgi:hypothetical protein